MTDLYTLPPADPVPGLRGWRRSHQASVGSTNQDLMAAARTGEGGRLWLTADEQVSGRGRRGRAWVSPPGNLYASVLLKDQIPDDAIGQLPLIVSLSVHDAVSKALPQTQRGAVTIKWPNDILIDGAKCCGILLEAEILRDGSRAIVAGCGINIVAHPPDTPYPATNLRQHGSTVDTDMMFAHLAQSFDAVLALWQNGANIAAIRSEWLTHAQGIGQNITVNLAQSTLEGIFEGIDAHGLLQLRAPDGALKSISAGDVFLR